MKAIKKLCILILLSTLFLLIEENNIGLAQSPCPAREACYKTHQDVFNWCTEKANTDLPECQTRASNYHTTCVAFNTQISIDCQIGAQELHDERIFPYSDRYFGCLIGDYPETDIMIFQSQLMFYSDTNNCFSEMIAANQVCDNERHDRISACDRTFEETSLNCSKFKEAGDRACAQIECPPV